MYIPFAFEVEETGDTPVGISTRNKQGFYVLEERDPLSVVYVCCIKRVKNELTFYNA